MENNCIYPIESIMSHDIYLHAGNIEDIELMDIWSNWMMIYLKRINNIDSIDNIGYTIIIFDNHIHICDYCNYWKYWEHWIYQQIF